MILRRVNPYHLSPVIRTIILSAIAGLPLSAFCNPAAGDASEIIERTATLRSLFAAEQIERLATVLPPDREVRWRVRVPKHTAPAGVLVFVSPANDATLKADWPAVLDDKHLIWIAAQEFGNSVPSNQRMLAALMALTLVQQNYAVDSSRVYISGMSGGGRIASMTITLFPNLFTGALYIVGADFWTTTEPALLALITDKRYVFLTGAKDFNRNEMRQVYRRYLDAGARHSLLMDLPRFGHEYPNARALDTAIQFLDADHISTRK